MQRWKNWASLLFAVVLSLGLVVGMAAADPPPEGGGHPGCENSGNQPKGCDDDGHPGDPGEGEDENGDDPLAPVGDACHQVVDEAVANGAPPEFEEGRQVCNALGGEQDDGGGDEEPDPCEEDPEAEECDGEDGENPLAPVGNGCHEVITEAVTNGAPEDIEQGRQLCDALGGEHEDDGDDGGDGGDGGDEGPDPAEEVADGCDEVVGALSDNVDPALGEAGQVCDAVRDGGGALGLV